MIIDAARLPHRHFYIRRAYHAFALLPRRAAYFPGRLVAP